MNFCMMNKPIKIYECLLDNCNIFTLHLRWIKIIVLKVFKSLNNLNLKCINEMFEIKGKCRTN